MALKPVACCLWLMVFLSLPHSATAEEIRFEVILPPVVLNEVPVNEVTIQALTSEGKVDLNYSASPEIRGLKLLQDGESVELPAFQEGVLSLSSALEKGRKLYVTTSQIEILQEGEVIHSTSLTRIWRWWAILPPVLAVILAIWLRNVLIALFLAIYAGAVILNFGNPGQAFLDTLQIYVIGQLVEQGMQGHSHMLIILFTLFLGAMIGVMSRGGGTTALVHSLARFCRKRNHGQMLTSGMGMVVFFDDYANTILVGGTMRPVMDRLRISRAKLAFLVDSTAAPVAGLAFISTWVGVEVGLIRDTYAELGMTSEVYGIFLTTIPYRFYPLYLLFFVWLLSWMGRDFGSMLKVEQRVLQGDPTTLEATTSAAGASPSPLAARKESLWTALIPLGVLLVSIVLGLYWTGKAGLMAENLKLSAQGEPEIQATLWGLLEYSNSNQVLLISSFLASIAAIIMVVSTRSLSLQQTMEAWLEGAKDMLLAVMILVLAWAISQLCDSEHLGTAKFVVELTEGLLPVEGMPTLAFLVSAAVAFATGSSWSTMGLLMPLFISLTYYLLIGEKLDAAEIQTHGIMLGTIGGILAGSIFGDHCSPISDTTILSSAASGCDHLEHVVTQMPYALTVAVIAILFGYLPIGFGWGGLWLWIPLGVAVMSLLIRFLGRSPEESLPLTQP